MEELCVTKSNGSLVQACAPTPQEMLHLSRIDRLPALRCYARTLHVFEALGPHGTAQSAIRQALSKALVPYYPLAGRLVSNPPQVQCTGEGVWFVEASANCTLESVGYFEDVTSIPFDKLLPHNPPQTQAIDPLVLMQVTEFEGDGFVMGLTFCHTICDGLGAAQFLNAVAEFARSGAAQHQLTISPIWHRNFLPDQPQSSPINFMLPPPPPPADYQLEQANIDIPLDQISRLKQRFSGSSTFEIVSALLWKNRTQAISSENRMPMKLVFFANCRHLVEPPLPKGFYGNCFFPVTVNAYSDTLARAGVGEVVEMIQDAKANLPKEFANWVNNGKEEKDHEDPFAPPLGYSTLFVSEWGKLGFNQVDYGKGAPLHVVPLQGSSIIPVAIVGSMPRPRKGTRVLTWCVHNTHLQPFLNAITPPYY